MEKKTENLGSVEAAPAPTTCHICGRLKDHQLGDCAQAARRERESHEVARPRTFIVNSYSEAAPAVSTSLVESPPEAYSANYEKLTDVPPDVLASRIVGSLILQKGNLNKYKAVLTKFIQDYSHRAAARIQELERQTYCHLCHRRFQGDPLDAGHGLGECVPLCDKCMSNPAEEDEDSVDGQKVKIYLCAGCKIAAEAEREVEQLKAKLARAEAELEKRTK